MRTMHPADELALIRADLHRLKEREAFLNKGILEMRLPTRGDDAIASVKVLKTRRLREDRLPPAIFENADYWETHVVRQVHVDDVSRLTGRVPAFVVDDGRFDVIERV